VVIWYMVVVIEGARQKRQSTPRKPCGNRTAKSFDLTESDLLSAQRTGDESRSSQQATGSSNRVLVRLRLARRAGHRSLNSARPRNKKTRRSGFFQAPRAARYLAFTSHGGAEQIHQNRRSEDPSGPDQRPLLWGWFSEHRRLEQRR